MKAKEAQTAAEQQKIKEATANRTALANKLITAFQSSSFRSFYAIENINIGEYKVTSDGREIRLGAKFIRNGGYLPLSHKAKFALDSTGFIKAYDDDKMYFFSPYSFEVK